MDINIYNRIWNSSIRPKIDKMTSANKDIVFVEGQIKDKIWLTYEECKNNVHTYMQNPDGRIDRHKVASVMLFSILENRPLEPVLPPKREMSTDAYLANETLGFNTALAIVFSFLMQEANEKNDNTKMEIFKNGFVFPDCQHGSYVTHIYKMLYYAKYNNCYDVFSFANILFLIEAYTEAVKKSELFNKVL